MQSGYVFGLLLIFSIAMTSRKCSAIQTCEDKALMDCVYEYAAGFADPKYKKLDDLKLHCLLDKVRNP
jgi:hypothetical protein